MKLKNITNVLVICLSAFSFAGCLNSETPECSDDTVIDTVKEVYTEMFTKNNANPLVAGLLKTLPKTISSLDSIRPISYDENVNLRTCKAQATLANNQTVDIQYTVQSVEKENGQFYVELNTDFLQNLMMSNIMNR